MVRKKCLSFALLLTFLMTGLLGTNAMSFKSENGIISVNTSSSMEIIPDVAEISFAVQTSHKESMQFAALENKNQVSESKIAYSEAKKAASDKRKLENAKKKAELQIVILEKRLEEIEILLHLDENQADYVKLSQLDNEKNGIEEQLLELYELTM